MLLRLQDRQVVTALTLLLTTKDRTGQDIIIRDIMFPRRLTTFITADIVKAARLDKVR